MPRANVVASPMSCLDPDPRRCRPAHFPLDTCGSAAHSSGALATEFAPTTGRIAESSPFMHCMERKSLPFLRWLCRGAVVLVSGGWWALPASAAEAPAIPGGPVAEVQQAATEWAKVRAETVRIESDWAWQRSLMQATLDALQEKVGQLEVQRDGLAAKTAGERREIEELETRRRQMAAAAAEAEQHLRTLAARLVRLRGWLPPRLSAALELPLRSLAAADLPAGERMQHTMTILNRCMHFNRTVTYGEELVAPEGGTPVLMETVYWGLSHGYALDRVAGVAYLGGGGPEGWRWTPAHELKEAVVRVIAVAHDRTEPAFVEIPVEVSDPETLNLAN